MTTMVGLYLEYKAKTQEIDAAFKKINKEIDGIKQKNSSLTSSFDGVSNKIMSMGKSIVNYGKWAAVALTGAAGGLYYMINKSAEAIDKITDTARGLGISAQAFQGLGYAASLSGVSIEEVEGNIKKMSMTLGQVFNGSQKLEFFDASSLKGLAVDEQFISIIKHLETIEDKNQRAAAAMEIFGRSGSSVLKLMGEGLLNNIEEFKKLGIVLTDSQRKAVDAFGDAQTRLSGIWSGFSEKVTAYVAPAFTQVINWISDTILEMGGIDSAAQRFAQAIVSGVKVAVQAISGIINIIDDIHARMIKMVIFAKESANKADDYNLVQAIGEKTGLVTQGSGAQRRGQRNEELAALYQQLSTVENSQKSRQDALQPLYSKLDQAKSNISDPINALGTSALDSALKSLAKSTNETADQVKAAGDKLNDFFSATMKTEGQSKLQSILGTGQTDKTAQITNASWDRQIKEIFNTAMDGSGGQTLTGQFNGKDVAVRLATAQEKLEGLQYSIDNYSRAGGDSSSILGYIGAMNELKEFLKKLDPNTNKVKVDVEVKASDDFIVKVAQSQQLGDVMQKAVYNIAESAARRLR